MRIKVGDEWHEAEPGKPIMVELTERDKHNLSNMFLNQSVSDKYALFHDDCPLAAAPLDWMREGAKDPFPEVTAGHEPGDPEAYQKWLALKGEVVVDVPD